MTARTVEDIHPRTGIQPSVQAGGFGFALHPTRSMVLATADQSGDWSPLQVLPFGPLPMSPAAGVLNYGQGVFEGMKARRSVRDRVVLFRPELNSERMNLGARRLCMPEVPEALFLQAVAAVVADNADYIPPTDKGTLYLRPLLIGSGAVLGVKAAPEYTFLIYVSPVGPYFATGNASLRLEVRTDVHRATPGGQGGVKAIGNYAPTILPAKEVKARGFHEVIYVDAETNTLIEEVGSANVFALSEGRLYTPALRGTILPGVTRRSVIELARARKVDVVEGALTLERLRGASEAFGTGTAATIAPIGSIRFPDGEEVTYASPDEGSFTREMGEILQGIQEERVSDELGWIRTLPALLQG